MPAEWGGNLRTITAIAGEDLTNAKYHALRRTGQSGQELFEVGVCSVPGEESCGVCWIGPPAGHPVSLAIEDECIVIAGAAISAGDELTTDAQGRAVTATPGDFRFATAQESCGAAGEMIRVLLQIPAVKKVA